MDTDMSLTANPVLKKQRNEVILNTSDAPNAATTAVHSGAITPIHASVIALAEAEEKAGTKHRWKLKPRQKNAASGDGYLDDVPGPTTQPRNPPIIRRRIAFGENKLKYSVTPRTT